MSVIMQEGIVSNDERAKIHYHWYYLCKSHFFFVSFLSKNLTNVTEHGKPDEVQEQQKTQTKLGNQLMGLFYYFWMLILSNKFNLDLRLYTYDEKLAETLTEPLEPPKAVLRVLPSMTLRILRLKICKVLKCDPRSTNIMFWLRMKHGALARLDDEHSTRDLDWLGLEHDAQIIYQIR